MTWKEKTACIKDSTITAKVEPQKDQKQGSYLLLQSSIIVEMAHTRADRITAHPSPFSIVILLVVSKF